MMIILDTFVYEGIAPRNYKNINNMILHLEAQGDNYLDLWGDFLNLYKLIHIVFDPIDHQDIYGIIACELMILLQPQ